MARDYSLGLSYAGVNPYIELSPGQVYPTEFYLYLPSLNPVYEYIYDDFLDDGYYDTVSGAVNGIEYFSESLQSQLYDADLYASIDFSVDREWYQTIQSVKNINDYSFGVAQYRGYDGSIVTLNTNGTGQYLLGNNFDFNTAGISTLYTSINYVGKTEGRLEESLVGKQSESYVATIGQKANADGMAVGLNVFQKTYANNYVYKDGLYTSFKDDNSTVTATNKIVETKSINTTATVDILSEAIKKDTSASVSYGVGSNNAYTSKTTETESSTATQTFNADSSIIETYKSNAIYTYADTETTKYSQDEIEFSGGTLTGVSPGYKSSYSEKETVTSDYASSINAEGSYKETSTNTFKLEESSSESGFVSVESESLEYYEVAASTVFTSTFEEKFLLDEQKPVAEETSSSRYTVAMTHSDRNVTNSITESFALTAATSMRSSEFDNGNNNVLTSSTEITKFTYANTQTVGTVINPLSESLDVSAKVTYTSGTSASGTPLDPTLAFNFTTGKYTNLDESNAVVYEMTTAASAMSINLNTTKLSGDEVDSVFDTVFAVQSYINNADSNSDPFETNLPDSDDYLYGLEGAKDSFLDLILLGNNTITIKSTSGAIVDAGLGNDTVNGGSGDDFITGGRGADILNGKEGFDTYFIDANSGSDLGKVGALFTGFDTISLDGNDTITYTGLGGAYNASGTGLANLTAANFTNADKAALFLNQFGSLVDGDVVFVTDSTTSGASTKGALYYYSDNSDGVLNALDIALIGVTTGVVEFGSTLITS